MFGWVFRLTRLLGFWLSLSVVAVVVLGTSTVWSRHQDRAEEVRRTALQERERELLAGIDRLALEWSRLNQPERLAGLARKHLDLQPVPVRRPAEIVEVLVPVRQPGEAGR